MVPSHDKNSFADFRVSAVCGGRPPRFVLGIRVRMRILFLAVSRAEINSVEKMKPIKATLSAIDEQRAAKYNVRNFIAVPCQPAPATWHKKTSHLS